MIAIITIAIGLGNNITYLVFAVLSYLTLREFITLTPTTPSDHDAVHRVLRRDPRAIPAARDRWCRMYSIFVPVHLFFAMSLVSALTQDTRDFLSQRGSTGR